MYSNYNQITNFTLTKALLIFFNRSITVFIIFRGGRYTLTSNSGISGSLYSSHNLLGIILMGISCIIVRPLLLLLKDGCKPIEICSSCM